MHRKDFKQALTKVLSEYGFEFKGNVYSIETEEIIIVVATQKSNFENSYYINFGFLVKCLNPDMHHPKDNQCDVFGRFSIEFNGQVHTSIEFEKINWDDFCSAFRKSVDDVIQPVAEFGIRKYFELKPSAINTATIKVKQYLCL